MPDNAITQNRSAVKDFLGSIATIRGDLSNITAPPFVLGDYSTVELPQYFADRPSLFVAPALEDDAEKRALLVLKNFLGSLRNQQYAGRNEEDGVKKPLNAFLGELFLGSWHDETAGETKLVCEQVRHHPPVTACYIYNEKHGISSEGFTQQAITFNGNVHIKQSGYAITHIDQFDEDYLIPLPSIKVKGVLSGTPYPELEGSYTIIASTGYISEVKFSGKGMVMGGSKHAFDARVYHKDNPGDTLYTASGHWNGSFSFKDARTKKEIDTFDSAREQTIPISVLPTAEQDPWESRRAWSGVLQALSRGDMKGTVNAKNEVEEGQRNLRHAEEVQKKPWQSLFFQRQDRDATVDRLSGPDRGSFAVDHETGVWKLDQTVLQRAQRPFHGGLLPTGETTEGQERGSGAPAVGAKISNGLTIMNKTAAQSDQSRAPTIANGDGPTKIVSNGVANTETNGASTIQIGSTGDVKASSSGTIDIDALTNVQIEEMLRNKYTSSRRGK
jgi:hypothetical protein